MSDISTNEQLYGGAEESVATPLAPCEPSNNQSSIPTLVGVRISVSGLGAHLPDVLTTPIEREILNPAIFATDEIYVWGSGLLRLMLKEWSTKVAQHRDECGLAVANIPE